jgi:hypothetical protein
MSSANDAPPIAPLVDDVDLVVDQTNNILPSLPTKRPRKCKYVVKLGMTEGHVSKKTRHA